MPEYLRVRDKATGHEYTIPEARLNEKGHTVLDKPALDNHGDPAAPKFRTSVAKTVEQKKKAESGQKATNKNEES